MTPADDHQVLDHRTKADSFMLDSIDPTIQKEGLISIIDSFEIHLAQAYGRRVSAVRLKNVTTWPARHFDGRHKDRTRPTSVVESLTAPARWPRPKCFDG